VFLLRAVFDYDYGEIADIVGKSEPNVRQLAVRARRQVENRRPRFEASRRQREELARRFFSAVEEGDTAALVDMLAADAVLYGDGGGKAPALARPVFGRERIGRVLTAWSGQGRRTGLTLELVEMNGQPGARTLDPAGRVVNVLCWTPRRASCRRSGRLSIRRSWAISVRSRTLGACCDTAASPVVGSQLRVAVDLVRQFHNRLHQDIPV
jgi:Sigma-70, region 4